ncbi:MAG: CDP-alcohol phosphatidyltransferase family protein [Pseudomonadota bacterium]
MPAIALLSWLLTIHPNGFAAALGCGIFVLGFCLALMALRTSYPHATLGYCNTVTTVRLMLTSILVVGLISPMASPWSVVILACINLLLDGVDGWLARAEGTVSKFGARFDLEVDSLFALVLSLYAVQSSPLGLFALFLGLPRYLFWSAQFAFPWLSGALPERFSRKLVCVWQIAVLLLLVSPYGHEPVVQLAAIMAILALIWSFALDVRWLWCHRP